MKWPIAAIILVFLGARGVSAQNVTSLPPGERPIQVSIHTYLVDFEQIDEATFSYKISGYLTLEWRDTRLAKASAPAFDREHATLGLIWHPNIELVNEFEARDVSNTTLTIDDDGLVRYEERFKAQLATDFNLRKFPFDRQTALMAIESFRFGADSLIFVARSTRELRSPTAFLPDWNIVSVNQRVTTASNNPDKESYSRYALEIEIARKFGYYMWSVFLPLALIALLPWAVFWIDPEDVRTRTSISMSALLTAIALSLVITRERPRVAYMTLFDAVFLNSYFLIFLATVSVVAAHFAMRRSRSAETAERLSAIGRRAYPALLVVSNIILVVIFWS